MTLIVWAMDAGTPHLSGQCAASRQAWASGAGRRASPRRMSVEIRVRRQSAQPRSVGANDVDLQTIEAVVSGRGIAERRGVAVALEHHPAGIGRPATVVVELVVIRGDEPEAPAGEIEEGQVATVNCFPAGAHEG